MHEHYSLFLGYQRHLALAMLLVTTRLGEPVFGVQPRVNREDSGQDTVPMKPARALPPMVRVDGADSERYPSGVWGRIKPRLFSFQTQPHPDRHSWLASTGSMVRVACRS